MKQTIVFDFDGVIHAYTKGWQKGIIYDRPCKNIKSQIENLRSKYKVVIVSTRCQTEQGKQDILNWLNDNNIEVDEVCDTKPAAIAYIDDRAIKYNEDIINLENMINEFQPDNKIKSDFENKNDLEKLSILQEKTALFQNLNNEFNVKYKYNPYMSFLILDEWIKSLQKYL